MATDDLKDLDRTDVKPLTEERLAEIEAQAKEFLECGNIYPEGTGLDNNGILWLIADRRRLVKREEDFLRIARELRTEHSAKIGGRDCICIWCERIREIAPGW